MTGNSACDILVRREHLLMLGPVEVIDEGGAGDFNHDRFFVPRLCRTIARIDREGRVIAGRAGEKELGRVEIAEIFVGACRLGLAVGGILAEGVDIEWQQHRHRAFLDGQKSLGADGVELGESLRRRIGAAAEQARRRRLPIDRAQRDGRALQLARGGGTAGEHGKADKCGTFQQLPLARTASPGAKRAGARVKSIIHPQTRADQSLARST